MPVATAVARSRRIQVLPTLLPLAKTALVPAWIIPSIISTGFSDRFFSNELARSISGRRAPSVLTKSAPAPAVCGLGIDWIGSGNGFGKFELFIFFGFD